MSVTKERQSQKPDLKVKLLTIDHPKAGVSRYCTTVNNPIDSIVFGGEQYEARQFSISGSSAQGGKLPRPSLRIDNTDKIWHNRAALYQEMRGAKVIYREVYRKNLDDGSDPDTSELITETSYQILQMKYVGTRDISFQLRTSADREVAKAGRICSRNNCQYRSYRTADTAPDTFIQGICPYTGPAYFERDGTPTSDWRKDECPQTRPACKLRHGEDALLPFLGFSGIGRKQT